MTISHKATKFILYLFLGSLIYPLLASFWLTWRSSNYWVVVGGLVIYIGGSCWVRQYFSKRGQTIDWFLSLACLNLFLLSPELILRQLDFHYEMGIQFGYPKLTSFKTFVPDEDLFWRLSSDISGVNALGFWGPEIEIPKSIGYCRMLILGDSVPRQGYPQLVAEYLNQQASDYVVESASLAEGGYSSYQGQILADRYGQMLEPDLVIVSYGWNDHWQAYDNIDSQKTVKTYDSWPSYLMQRVYHHTRLLQGLRYLLTPWLGGTEPLAQLRVPANEYQANLIYIGQRFSEQNVPVIFITPPSAHPTLGVPDYLIIQGFAANKANVLAFHQSYNHLVRHVARRQADWYLLDLERILATHPDRGDIFMTDGIHLTPLGLETVAQTMAEFIEANLAEQVCFS